MENLILQWQKRQQKYEKLAEEHKDNPHNNRKFIYKAIATRDCWKELALQLRENAVSGSAYNFSKDYSKLYKLLCSGIEVAGYVDYQFRTSVGKYPPSRDLCKIKRRGEYDIYFGVRGIEYGSVSEFHKKEDSELELLKLECERMNVEFIVP